VSAGSEEGIWGRLNEVEVRLLLGCLPRSVLAGLARDLGVSVKGWRLETAPARLLARQLAVSWARQADLRPALLHAILSHVHELVWMIEGLPVAALRSHIPGWVERWGAPAVALCLELDDRITVQKLAPSLWARAQAEDKGEEAPTPPPAGTDKVERELAKRERRQRRLLQERDQTIARLEKEVAALEQKLAQREQEKARWMEAARRLEREKGELVSQLEALRGETDRLCQELQEPLALQGRVSELAAALAQAESQAQGYQASCAQLSARVQDLEGQVAALTRELEARDTQIDQLRARLAQRDTEAVRVPRRPDPSQVLDRLVTDLERIVRSVPPAITGPVQFQQGWGISCGGVRVALPDDLARGLRLLEGDEVGLSASPAGGVRVYLTGRVQRRTVLGYLRLGEESVVRTLDGEEWLLAPGEAQAVGAAEGDPVTIEVPEGARPGDVRARVVQVHRAENPAPAPGIRLRRVRTVRRKAPAAPEADTQELFPGDWLKDWRILVVGGDGQEQWYRQAVEQRGGIFEWHSGFEGLRPLAGKVRTADIIVLVTSRMSHKASDLVREASEKFTKKLVYCNELGAGALVRSLAGALLPVRQEPG